VFFSAAEGRDRIAGDNKILRAITGVTGVMLVAKLLAVLRNILQARVFGTGAEIDVFTQVNNYSVSLFTTIAYALCVAAVPIFSQRLLTERKQVFQTADRLISNTMLLSLGAGAVLLLLNLFGVIGRVVGIGEYGSFFRFGFGIMLISLPIIMLTYLLVALFQSLGHFALQGTLSLLYNLVLCAILVVFGDKLSLRTFVTITSVSWLLQLAMALPYVKKEHYHFRLSIDLRDRQYWRFLRTGVVTVLNSSLFLFCYLLNTRMAASAAEGTISAFFYAERFYEPMATTIIYSVGIVMFPHFSQKFGQISLQEYGSYVVRVMKNALLIVLPVSALFFAFGTPIIRVLFEGGSFTAEDSLQTGMIFSLYALGMAGFFAFDLLSKAYYAMGKTLIPLFAMLATLGLCAVLNVICAQLAPARPALLAAGTATAFLAGGLGLFLWFARGQKVKFPAIPLLVALVAASVLGVGGYWIGQHVLAGAQSKFELVWKCGVAGGVGLLAYLPIVSSLLPISKLLRKKKNDQNDQ